VAFFIVDHMLEQPSLRVFRRVVLPLYLPRTIPGPNFLILMLNRILSRLNNAFARTLVRALPLVLATFATAMAAVPAAAPVRVGLDAEFGLDNSTSAQAVELGLRTAIGEINRAGGVLGGRPVELVTRDHRSLPARGIRNIEELARTPDLVAVFGGRFSPVIIEELPPLKATRTLFLAPWSSADAIVDNDMQPNYVYRLSLRDSLAMPRLLETARKRGLGKVGLLLTNTSRGRSNLAAAEKFAAAHKDIVSIDRKAVRDALEQVREHRGLIKTYAPPFTPGRHEALGARELLIARYRADGVLVPTGE
jgi:hypothetical protein